MQLTIVIKGLQKLFRCFYVEEAGILIYQKSRITISMKGEYCAYFDQESCKVVKILITIYRSTFKTL